MGKRQMKKMQKWQKLLLGLGIDVLIYFVGILLITACVIGGGVNLNGVSIMLPMWAGMVTACGNLVTCGRKSKEMNAMRLVQASMFLVVLIAGSYLFWEGPVWDKRILWFVMAILTGSGLSALLAVGGKRKNRRAW